MKAQNCSAQQRRILNLIWASAGEYNFTPLFMAYGTDKKPDYYMNCMIGFVHKWYGDQMVQDLFAHWEGDPRQGTMDDLAWLALENAAYEKELAERPVLKDLRKSHAEDFFAQEFLLSRQEWMAKNQLVYSMQNARWKEVLGKHLPPLSPREKALYGALCCSGTLSPQALSEEILSVMRKFFLLDGKIRPGSQMAGHLRKSLLALFKKAAPAKMVRTDYLKIGPSRGGTEKEDLLPVTFAGGTIRYLGRDAAEKDRLYIERCFGRSLYSPRELALINGSLCTDTHFSCHLWFTDGSSAETSQDAESRRLTEQAAAQQQRNLEYYESRRNLHENAIRRLSLQIGSCSLLYQEAEEYGSRRGRLNSVKVWREPVLGDDHVFTLREEDPHPSFTVDLLLDGSASRLRSQELIAAQGYILSESLTRCSIPVRVSSFCSLRSYTVLRILKDYGENRGQKKIFSYFAAGWNRDGLALRGMKRLLEDSPCEKHLIILLTDASPSDSHKIPPVPSFPVSREYDGQAGIDDAAREVQKLRKAGIRVAAVFMGVNSSLPGARQIFGNDMVRIRGIDQLASAAGKLIEKEIRDLSG